MRQIKFRMWNGCPHDRTKKKYFYDNYRVLDCIKQQAEFDEKESNFLGYNHLKDGSVFEQFTGLKDKNGNDIYEGDIVEKTKYPRKVLEVIYINGKFNISDYVVQSIRVIGNILKKNLRSYLIYQKIL